MIPMLRVLSRGISRFAIVGVTLRSQGGGGTQTTGRSGPVESTESVPAFGRLPAVVRERFVRFGHLLDVVAALDRGADAVGGVHELTGEALGHGLFAPLTGVADDPADGERVGPTGLDLDRHLVRGTADPPALHFQRRFDVVDR